jgi:hypothetical protein
MASSKCSSGIAWPCACLGRGREHRSGSGDGIFEMLVWDGMAVRLPGWNLVRCPVWGDHSAHPAGPSMIGLVLFFVGPGLALVRGVCPQPCTEGARGVGAGCRNLPCEGWRRLRGVSVRGYAWTGGRQCEVRAREGLRQ